MKLKNTLRTLGAMCVAIAATVIGSAGSARADHVDLQQVLHGNARCDHVIAMLHRHGVNNSRPSNNAALLHPLNGFAIPASELGDLQLVQITQASDLEHGCGPKFFVTIKNTSTRDVCGFRVTLVGLFGRIQPLSPNCTVKVDKICPGQAIEIPITLPIEALSMGNHNGQVLGCQRILVVIDSFDQFMECDEANNLRVFNRNEIPVAAAVVESVSTAQPAAAADVTQAAPATQSAPVAQESNAIEAKGQAAAPGGVTDDLKSALTQFSDKTDAELAQE